MQVSLVGVGVLLMALGVCLIIWSNFILYTIIEEVNARNPADQQISIAFVQSKMGKIYRRHRELYPNSPKRRKMYIVAIAAGVLLFAGFALAILPNFIAGE